MLIEKVVRSCRVQPLSLLSQNRTRTVLGSPRLWMACCPLVERFAIPIAVVEEGNLTQYISHLRKALGNNSEDTRLIVTIARKGYQFTANVTFSEAADSAREASVQVPTAESLQANAQPIHELPASATVPKASWNW